MFASADAQKQAVSQFISTISVYQTPLPDGPDESAPLAKAKDEPAADGKRAGP